MAGHLYTHSDRSLMRLALVLFGKETYRELRVKHFGALRRLSPNSNYPIETVPRRERLLFAAHCILYGRQDNDVVLLLSGEHVCRRNSEGRILYPHAMRYQIIENGTSFYTDLYEFEKHYRRGMTVIDRRRHQITFDGVTWKAIGSEKTNPKKSE